MWYRFWLCCFCFLLFSPHFVFAAPDALNTEEEYKSLELLTDVLSLVQNNYVEAVTTEQMIRGAVRGILETLDPHSSYLSPEMYEELRAETHGEFGGVGIELTIRDKDLIVVAPIEHSPACRAGILPGDQVIAIDGRQARDLDMMEAVRLLRGASGEAVTLSLKRAGHPETIEVTLIREMVKVVSVRSRLFEKGYGYVRVSQFQERTDREVAAHLDRLRGQGKAPLTGVILDLRNNPGGLLEQAVAVADIFLDQGLIVSIAGRHPETRQSFRARQEGTEPGYPLVVLINGGSASAAEIVAGALQDHNRALILGEQSFGKGSVQTIIPLIDDSGLRLTTAHYFTPSGHSIQALGITPDIFAQQLSLQRQPAPPPAREQDLEKHLPPPVGAENADGMTSEEREAQLILQHDYQLQRALDLLKGFSRFSGKSSVPAN